MTKEQIDVCKEVLKKFIYEIRTNEICELTFHYYSDNLNNSDCKFYPFDSIEYKNSFDYNRTKKQISKKILTNKDSSIFWNLSEKDAKLLENFCINYPKDFDNLFKEYIDFLWKCDLKNQIKEFEQKEKEEKEKDIIFLKEILKEKYDVYSEIVNLILKDTVHYPYKSDKIKVLLELELNTDIIFDILQSKENLKSPKGYIEKYYKERQEGIKQNKITVYEFNSVFNNIYKKLKNRT